ncbi:unnamed protein product, partial [Medioppia subpectinata]
MSVAFIPQQKSRQNLNPQQIQKMLDENTHLIQCIVDYQNKGKGQECLQYQQQLHRNLVYLASIAETNPNISALLPPPQGFTPTTNAMNNRPPSQSQTQPMSQTQPNPSAQPPPPLQSQSGGQPPQQSPAGHPMPQNASQQQHQQLGQQTPYSRSMPSSQSIPAG